MKAILLSAGLGKRMRPLTNDLPKPLLEVGGRPLIDWQLEKLAAVGVTDVVVNVFWQGEKLQAHLGEHRFGVSVAYTHEAELLETGGGIFNALHLLGEQPFWVANGDVWSDVDLNEYADFKAGQQGKLLLVENPQHNKKGDFSLSEDGLICPGSQFTYSGYSLLTARLFEGCAPGAFPLRPLLDRAIRQSALSGAVLNGRWVDVGTPERLKELDSSLAGH